MTTISTGVRVAQPANAQGERANTGRADVQVPAAMRAGTSGEGALLGTVAGGATIAGVVGLSSLASPTAAPGWVKGVGIAAGIAAAVGGVVLMHQRSQSRTEEHFVPFAQSPDLAGVPPGDVYATLVAHHERLAPPVVAELERLQQEEMIRPVAPRERAWEPIIGANGFVVDVVRRHADEVERRLEAVSGVGDVVASQL